jgi:hypothetical protein
MPLKKYKTSLHWFDYIGEKITVLQSPSLLALTTFGKATHIGIFLFVLQHTGWPREAIWSLSLAV